jgi:hypothetical protein
MQFCSNDWISIGCVDYFELWLSILESHVEVKFAIHRICSHLSLANSIISAKKSKSEFNTAHNYKVTEI